MVKIKIHRGTSQIGGTITEIYTDNTHIFIDFGSELSVDPEDSTDQKMVDMINSSRCDAVLFSHYHGDHVGLMGSIPMTDIDGKMILLGMGSVARDILKEIHRTLDSDFNKNAEEHHRLLAILNDEKRWFNFSNKNVFKVGDFTITPVRVDHSAYDAYMFVIEAEGKTIVHTGDYRTHGRFGKELFPDLENALADKKVDILLTEGTMMERKDEDVLSETQLEEKAKILLAKPENKWAFLVCSSTNVESLASFHNAAMKLGRPFIVNYYVYNQILRYRKTAGARDKRFLFLKTYPFENMNKINPKLGGLTQPEFMMENGFIMLVGKSDAYKKRMEYFRDKDPLLIYSMWEGYINKEKYPDAYDEKMGRLVKEWRKEDLHTSGHATVEEITKVIKLVNPNQGIIPIHTTRKDNFKKLDIGKTDVILLQDGEEYLM